MKKVLFVFMITFAFVACKTDKVKEVVDETKEAVVKEVEKTMDNDNEFIEWAGNKVVAGGHMGKIFFSDVNFEVKDGMLTGGEFVIDMNSLTNDDLSGKKAEDLLKHLKSADFFEVEKYPTAKFKILGVEKAEGDNMFDVTGSLTIKDVTKNITVPATVQLGEDGKVSFESEFNIDRSAYNVNYGSPTKFVDIAKDHAIKDEVALRVVLK